MWVHVAPRTPRLILWSLCSSMNSTSLLQSSSFTSAPISNLSPLSLAFRTRICLHPLLTLWHLSLFPSATRLLPTPVQALPTQCWTLEPFGKQCHLRNEGFHKYRLTREQWLSPAEGRRATQSARFTLLPGIPTSFYHLPLEFSLQNTS